MKELCKIKLLLILKAIYPHIFVGTGKATVATQHALVSLIEKWKVSRDKEGYTGAILMDLSKAFDTLNDVCISCYD